MRRADLLVLGRRIATPDGVRPGAIVVTGERIAAVEPEGAPLPPADRTIDAGGLFVLPGLVDTHVHVNEPGRTEWEGFRTATDAAAAGGVTTVVDMPLNSHPPTTTRAAAEAKLEAMRGACRVDVGMWGGLVPGNLADIEPLLEAGVLGLKAFLVASGVDDFPPVDEEALRRAMRILAGRGLPLLAHAELPGPIESAAARLAGAPPRAHATWLASRPPEAETAAVELLVRLCRETACRTHVVHVSAASAVDAVAAAREEGLPLTAETCPHYLLLTDEEVPEGATEFKCAPPIREVANRERLWEGLTDGTLALVASDHSPCPPAWKRPDSGDFLAAWGGIASLELSLSVVWTAARPRGVSPERLAEWMSAAPARLAGLADRKGAIRPGADADFILFDPGDSFVVDPAALRQRHPVTPYAGRTLRGRARDVFLRGEPVVRAGEIVGRRRGDPVPRPAPAERTPVSPSTPAREMGAR